MYIYVYIVTAQWRPCAAAAAACSRRWNVSLFGVLQLGGVNAADIKKLKEAYVFIVLFMHAPIPIDPALCCCGRTET